MKFSTLILGALAPAAYLAATIERTYNSATVNETDHKIRNITFTVDFGRNPKVYDYAFDIYFLFKNTSKVVHAGVNLWWSSGTKFYGTLNSHLNQTTTNDPKCQYGTNKKTRKKKEGVSCKVTVYDWKREIYKFQFARSSETSWEGVLINTESGNVTSVGSFSLPPGTGSVRDYYWFQTAAH
ncbi:hypothetical protein PT974_01419 [Cladobotryum mycophilum]|uniref:Uncharacterized protein n=1 Tax=Cladobotryum mycophilum TaxID=491253 RepID=A0ABR0T4K3_9HYPO